MDEESQTGALLEDDMYMGSHGHITVGSRN